MNEVAHPALRTPTADCLARGLSGTYRADGHDAETFGIDFCVDSMTVREPKTYEVDGGRPVATTSEVMATEAKWRAAQSGTDACLKLSNQAGTISAQVTGIAVNSRNQITHFELAHPSGTHKTLFISGSAE
jgi:hypothetical protein